ncbi:unnamed protein product [Spirodela intermedia]|uniref:LsmAD domain-containing protein n=1 Tax=Spirodela intermedia TaxID=51605 RepID=A0A7I8LFU6_SPIIN|nr:unnamed protein product [Spirodela intermedia]
MNLQPVVQSRSSANGFIPRRNDGEMGSRTDSKSHIFQMTKSSYGSLSNGGDTGGFGGPSRDRLIFVSTCLIGHSVEVHVKNGSVLSGIFHTINAEKDFGIVLKMARITKDGSVRGPKPVPETVKKPQTMIIPARELVQVIAKGISLTNDGFSSGSTHEKRQDFMTDSAISQSRRVDVERELERWTPDKDDPQCPELENIFDKHWNRSWNQFETNEALFGVKTTFNEELYTTKLERGPQMREREREALRIAREIEGEDTKDLHLAEERGIHFNEDFDFDEEARFSSVYRGIGGEMDRENEDIILDDVNSETFGGSFRYGTNQQFSEISQRKNNGAQATSSSSSRDEDGSSLDGLVKGVPRSDTTDHARQLTTDGGPKTRDIDGSVLDEKQLGYQGGRNFEDDHTEKSVNTLPSLDTGKCSIDKGALSASATAYSPSSVQETKDSKSSFSATNQLANPQLRPSSSTSSSSEKLVEISTSSGLNLPPSPSAGFSTSEKSMLNPHAKEFKLNPNAKSFVPSSSIRPNSPVTDSSFYYPQNPTLSQMHGLPLGVSMGSTFPGQQPVVYNPQGLQMQTPQGYISPTGPLYGQQMIMGQPRPVFYMPGYPQDMPYKGREF